ncbi:MAG: hypothetical protein HW421_4081 [Ignavibacteria bacterium]|nr:hypothetical protein [Ignavibacteria bacterium]
MLNIKKQTVHNQNDEIISVMIDYQDYLRLEEIFEDYGLAKLIDEAKNEEYLSGDEAKLYYQSLQGKAVEN